MQTVTSKDGTTIAYDRLGEGPTLIVIGGALSYRSFSKMQEIAEEVAARGVTVVNYDRRGRGDSTEATPFAHETAVEREIEDIRALIEAEGGKASLWGWSSGGALALRAAAALPELVEKVSVYEVPFIVDPAHKYPTPDYEERLDELVAADDRTGAASHFMRNAIGMPAPFVLAMRLMPMWKALKANAQSLPYDWEALGRHTMYGEPLAFEEWARVEAPVQVVFGGKSPRVLQEGSKALARLLPDAEIEELPGVSHNVKVDALAPVVASYITGERARAGRSATTLLTV